MEIITTALEVGAGFFILGAYVLIRIKKIKKILKKTILRSIT